MQPESTETVRLGWIALIVGVDSDGKAKSAHAVVHAEKGVTPDAALTLAQVAKSTEAELRRLVSAHEAGEERAPAVHSAICAMDGDASTCPCQRPISSFASGSDCEAPQ